MKTAKLIIGIISLVLFVIIAFQSCAVGVVNALDSNAADTSGAAGMMVAIFFLVAGIVGIVTRISKGGGITAGSFFIAAGLLGIANMGTYGDLVVWAIVGLIFGTVFLCGSIIMQKPPAAK